MSGQRADANPIAAAWLDEVMGHGVPEMPALGILRDAIAKASG